MGSKDIKVLVCSMKTCCFEASSSLSFCLILMTFERNACLIVIEIRKSNNLRDRDIMSKMKFTTLMSTLK